MTMTHDDRNAAAELWRRTFATNDNPFEGISIGFQDTEDAAKFVLSVASHFADLVDDDPENAIWETADAATPVYTSQILAIVSQLPLWVAHEEIGAEVPLDVVTMTLEQAAKSKLFEVAYRIAAQLASEREEPTCERCGLDLKAEGFPITHQNDSGDICR